MRRLLPLILLLSLLIAAPASANKSQALTFEAPRDLMNPATRPAALQELESLGVRVIRVFRQMPDAEQWLEIVSAARNLR